MPDSLEALFARQWLGASGTQWAVALTIILVVTPTLILLRRLIAGRLRALASKTPSDFDDFLVKLIERTRGWFFALLSLRLATLVFDLPERWDHRAQIALVAGGMLQAGIWATALIRYLVDRRFAHHARGSDTQVVPVAQTLLRFAGMVAVWSVVLLAVLSAFGIDITALVAGLGVGGIAIALAVQRVLGDVLASISIALDKPFVPGDSIAVGDKRGTVHRIGLRSTILGGLGGEELVLPNNDLLASRISNFTRMRERRIDFKISVPYDTEHSLLEALPALLKAQIAGREQVRFDRAALTNLAESGVEFTVVYWVLSPEYSLYVQIHQAILLAILGALKAGGYTLSAASPTFIMAAEPPQEPVFAPQTLERAPGKPT